jgi:DNA-binding XRE family transcriptional regulator
MNSEIQVIQLSGKPYVILPRKEYERLTLLAKAESLPPVPSSDRRGTVPAVDYARASIARKIIARRAELGLSQRELARLAGVRVETLCRIETGKVSPTVATIERIDRALAEVVTPAKSRESR